MPKIIRKNIKNREWFATMQQIKIAAKPRLPTPPGKALEISPSGGDLEGAIIKKHVGYYVTKQLRFNSNIF